ncbi:protein dispatched homolog 1-like isoform X3 [Acropora millepora]|uniref:protein dispatched homolog 1-like isoform X3 n=1 Tax=Acropora millepora TaxID=45264 RepID=UPI0010FC9C07|nr:protein dispatched homolog 1-like isoform X3 [Acropora millepora]
MAAYIFHLLVRKPKICFGLTLAAHFLLLLVTGALYLSGYDILPADFTQVPLNLEDDVTKLRADAWKFARQDSRVTINPKAVGIQKERTIQYDLLELMYEAEDGNVLTKDNLKSIRDAELEIFNISIYQQRLCQMKKSGFFFIILGIGADDVFVFVDAWKASELNSFGDLSSRMSFVYRRAARVMFTTSFTTMVAFITSVFSPLLGVSTFGIFSALLVFVNYCSVIIFLPTVIVTYELYWKDYRWHCFGDLKSLQAISSRREDNVLGELADDRQERRKDNFVKPSHIVSDFLCNKYVDMFIGHRTMRWIILGVFLVFLCTTVGFAMQLEPDEEPIDVWGPGTNWYISPRLRRTAFRPSQEDDVVEVNVIWGLKDQDRSSCHFTDFKCKGKTVFDNSFDLNPTECQEAILKFCHELRNLQDHQMEKLRIRRNAVSGEPEIQCFMEKLKQYLQTEVTRPHYSNNTRFTIPTRREDVRLLMSRNPHLFDITRVSDKYHRYFEALLGYWLTHANQSVASHDYHTYGGLLGGSMDPTDPSHIPNYQGGQYGNRLLFASVAVNTTMVLSKTGQSEGLKIFHNWENFVRRKVKKMPLSCKNAFQATPNGHNAWHWLKVKKVLASTAVRGILLGLGSAISLLVVMTSNWIVGLLCGAIIACITVGVVGVIPLAGWKLGVLESLNLTLVVGLAVDYVVHLADGYVRSNKQSRRDKVRETLGQVGISVLSGASTTLGASVFMLAAKILFFFQFGIFMFCTIGFSIAYALILFTTILAIFGPEGNSGSLQPPCNWFNRKPVQEEHPCEDITNPVYQSPTICQSRTATSL